MLEFYIDFDDATTPADIWAVVVDGDLNFQFA
jgi:hypothetical protein